MTPVPPLLYLAAIVVGYLVGSLNPAATIARLRGVDLRASGSPIWSVAYTSRLELV